MRARPALRATLALLLLSAAACATNPATGRKQVMLISPEQEVALGRQADEQTVATIGLYEDDDVQRYVRAVGNDLARDSERPDLPWTFRVVDDPAINAFALPGGYIYVTRGIMTHLDSEAELAGVIGHEIGHVTARHGANRVSKAQLASFGLGLGMLVEPELRRWGGVAGLGLDLLFLKFSRDDERQADDLGLRYLTREGYDPREMEEVFDVLQASGGQERGALPSWLSTHPTPEDRGQRIARVVKVSRTRGTVVNRDVYLRQLDGMVFGENPRDGFFEAGAFHHPDLRFTMEFPEGWKTRNTRQLVAGTSERQDAVVMVTLVSAGTPEEAARRFFSQRNVASGRPWAGRVNGIPAVSRVFEAKTGQGTVRGLAAFLDHEGRIFRLIGYAPRERFAAYDEEIARALSSFGELTDPRALEVEPLRIEIVRPHGRMTLQRFAELYPSKVPLETLALINHMSPRSEIPAGTPVKRVVNGV